MPEMVLPKAVLSRAKQRKQDFSILRREADSFSDKGKTEQGDSVFDGEKSCENTKLSTIQEADASVEGSKTEQGDSVIDGEKSCENSNEGKQGSYNTKLGLKLVQSQVPDPGLNTNSFSDTEEPANDEESNEDEDFDGKQCSYNTKLGLKVV